MHYTFRKQFEAINRKTKWLVWKSTWSLLMLQSIKAERTKNTSQIEKSSEMSLSTWLWVWLMASLVWSFIFFPSLKIVAIIIMGNALITQWAMHDCRQYRGWIFNTAETLLIVWWVCKFPSFDNINVERFCNQFQSKQSLMKIRFV